MASIVVPDLPLEAFYYKNESLALSSTPESARDSWVVWPPILSSDCSTWLATRKAKSVCKEARDDSLNQWLVPSNPPQSGTTDYVAAIREGLEKSMDAFAEYLRESTPPSSESSTTAESHETVEDDGSNPWLVPSTSRRTSRDVVDKISSYLRDAHIENELDATSNSPIPPTASPGLWLGMSDCIGTKIGSRSRAESIISDAMSTITMETEEDSPNEGWSVWLSTESQDLYAFDGVESEASIEIIDFENMDEI